MGYMKRVVAGLLAAMMLIPTVAVSAATVPSPAKKTIAKSNVSAKDLTYNGKSRNASVTVTVDGNKLKKGTDYTVTLNKTAKNAGSYKVTVQGIGNYTGKATVSFKINQAKQTITAANATYKRSKLKKNTTISVKAKGKLSYKVTKGSKYLKVKNGKLVLVKNAKKGTYKATITAAKTTNYKKATKTITIKVK